MTSAAGRRCAFGEASPANAGPGRPRLASGPISSLQMHTVDSVRRASPRLPGEGRDLFLPWAPAFAGVTGILT
jgi:hypothetical protein